MKKILDKRNMTEQDWQAYREKQNGIGGSEVASILGVQPSYAKSKFILWLEKTGQKEPEKVDNEYIKWGNILEPVVRKQFAEETGFKVFQNNFVLQHDEHDFMIANLDGEVIDPNQDGRGVLEIKTTSEWNKKDWEGDYVPVAYMAQIQHYLAVTGYKYAYIVCLIGGNKMRYWFIERDEEVINGMIEAEREFIYSIQTNTPPEIGGSKNEADWLNATFPEAKDEESSIPETIEAKALEYAELSRLSKEAKARMDEIKNQIKLEAKEIKTLKGNQVKILMPTITKTLLDTKALEKDEPILFAKYKTKVSTYRDFKIKELEA